LIKEKLGLEIIDVPGAGAAGGLGAGLIVFCNAAIFSGIDVALDINGIDRHLMDADLVITGEGQIDSQTVCGKVPVGVAKRALKYGVPVIAIVGSVGKGASAVYEYGIDAIMDIVTRPMSLNDSMKNVSQLLEYAAENVMRMLSVGNHLQGQFNFSKNNKKALQQPKTGSTKI
jgi:glycerate kinase